MPRPSLSLRASDHTGSQSASPEPSPWGEGGAAQAATDEVASHNGYTYTYDKNGNILTISDGTNTTSYVYDSANQLIRENNQALDFTQTWEYDNAGNILSRTEYAYTTVEDLSTISPTDTVTYGYTDENWGDKLTSYDGNAIAYDNIGNPLSDGKWSYTWKHGRQLTSMSNGTVTWTYTYDANGMRTGRTSSNGYTYEYVYNGDLLVQVKSNFGTVYITYDANGTPLTIKRDNQVYYYVTNLQGDVIAIKDSSGVQVVSYTYDAWGRASANSTNVIGICNPLSYRGYVSDRETGLYYLQSRYYNPEWGRFINADAFPSTGQGFLGNNMFAYCQNNPVLFEDSSGFIIVLSSDATEEQIEEYERAIAYLKTSETGRKLIELLDGALRTFTITFVDDDGMYYDPNTQTIYFDPNSGLIMGDYASVQSAALGLAHEMGHAAQDLAGLMEYETENTLEQMNLETYEKPIASELGEPVRNSTSDSRGTMNMQNSTHFRTAIIKPRPFWHYILFWKLLSPYAEITDHNVIK